MKKMIVTTFALAMMGSSIAFADTNKLSAFQGVETASVSATELNEVSGEGLLSNLLGVNLLGNVLNSNLIAGVLGTVTNLNLLGGVNVQSSTSVSTGALIGGVTGIQGATIGLSVH